MVNFFKTEVDELINYFANSKFFLVTRQTRNVKCYASTKLFVELGQCKLFGSTCYAKFQDAKNKSVHRTSINILRITFKNISAITLTENYVSFEDEMQIMSLELLLL